MKAGKFVTLIVGMIQSVVAILAMILACFVFFNFFDVQSLLGMAVNINLYIFILLVFGIVSFISGVFLLFEWWENR